MFKKILIIFLCLTLSFTTIACGENTENKQAQNTFTNNVSSAPQIKSGKYPIQQATYNDVNGEYSLMLLNSNPPLYRTTELQMARLTDEQLQAGEKTYLDFDGSQAVMYLTEDFKIEYVHNETETVTNPQTGQPETIVVRQQSSFWSPFAGALAGQALGSMLFRPQYYVPPMYQGGGIMTGYGGYGGNYSQAVSSYQSRYQSPPPAVKNRQTLRTTGTINRAKSNSTTKTTPKSSINSTKSTGSGFGSSSLKSSGNSTSNTIKRSSGFGSSSSVKKRSSFSGSRRRR